MRRSFLRLLARRHSLVSKQQFAIDAVVALALAFPLSAHATDGYFSNACVVMR
jgi:hypothetical protein